MKLMHLLSNPENFFSEIVKKEVVSEWDIPWFGNDEGVNLLFNASDILFSQLNQRIHHLIAKRKWYLHERKKQDGG